MSEAEAVQPQASARLKTARTTTDDDAQLAQCLQEEEVAAARGTGSVLQVAFGCMRGGATGAPGNCLVRAAAAVGS